MPLTNGRYVLMEVGLGAAIFYESGPSHKRRAAKTDTET